MGNQIIFPLRSSATRRFVCGAAIAAAVSAAASWPAAAATIACSTVAACVLANNISPSSKGPAIAGLSQSGDGIQGRTYFTGGTSSSNAKSGIAGFDLNSSSNRYNSGVFGFSAVGSGVHASTRDGSGVLAVAAGPYGIAVNAMSHNVGLLSRVDGSQAIGVRIRTSSPDKSDVALVADASQSGNGIYAIGKFGGVSGTSYGSGGVGVFGTTFADAVGVWAEAEGTSAAIPLLVQSYQSDTLIDAQSYPNGAGPLTNVLTLDHNGNLDVYGHITAKASAMFETRRADGRRVMAYAPREAEATIEDVGEAQLTAGVAAVPLAADFAQTVNFSRPYHVFVTPEGENHGLYVTQKTARGFIVRESGGGRSTTLIEYRIVATPRDLLPSRLPSEESLARKLSGPAYHNDASDRRQKELRERFAKRLAAR